MLVAGILIAGTLFIMGLVIVYGKQYWLIAGYNTMSQEKQKKVDVEGLARFMGNWLLFLAVLVLLGLYLGLRFSAAYFHGAMLLFTAGIICMVVRAQRFDQNVKSKAENRNLRIALAFSSLVVIGVAALIYYASLTPRVEVTKTGIEIHGMYSTTILVEEITQIALEDHLPRVLSRNNGLGLGEIRNGHFTLEGLGRGRLYTQSDAGPFIYIFCDSSFIIINYKDPSRTEALYESIMELLES